MVVRMTSCCCSCRLDTGSVLIAVLGTICSLIALVTSVTIAVYRSSYYGSYPETAQFNAGLVIFCIMYGNIAFVHLILSIVLIFGVSSKSPKLVKAWILVAGITTVLLAMVQFTQIITMLLQGLFLFTFLGLVFYAVATSFIVYFILVVNSYYAELTSKPVPAAV